MYNYIIQHDNIKIQIKYVFILRIKVNILKYNNLKSIGGLFYCVKLQNKNAYYPKYIYIVFSTIRETPCACLKKTWGALHSGGSLAIHTILLVHVPVFLCNNNTLITNQLC